MRRATAFQFFKYAIYGLLAVNIVLFFRHATFHEGMDSIGWLLLLLAFEYQTRSGASRKPVLRMLLLQALAYGLILYAWGNYLWHGQWLDAVNTALWLGVVSMIEFDIFRPGRHGAYHKTLKIGLYTGLVTIAVAWGVTQAWLDFYDAMLWIACFFAIEMNILGKWLKKA